MKRSDKIAKKSTLANTNRKKSKQALKVRRSPIIMSSGDKVQGQQSANERHWPRH
jgi:hypothetical protein